MRSNYGMRDCAAQAGALCSVAFRELRWVMPIVSDQVAACRDRASQMPPGPIRDDALSTLVDERFNTEGAALFATLPAMRNPALVRLLATFEIIWDFLDTVSERPCDDMVGNGLQMHRALADALDPGAPIPDYFLLHPWRDDGGYLRWLVETCRAYAGALPSFDRVRPMALREAQRGAVSAVNHEPDSGMRDRRLIEFAERELPIVEELEWFELTGAASSSLTVHALLALAAEPDCTAADMDAVYHAYYPWISLASTMLDSYADFRDDMDTGAHSYVGHYGDLNAATVRIGEIVRRSARLAGDLPHGRRHLLIATGMVAMYLSKESARAPDMAWRSRTISRAPGPLPRTLQPILRVWRRAAGLP